MSTEREQVAPRYTWAQVIGLGICLLVGAFTIGKIAADFFVWMATK